LLLNSDSTQYRQCSNGTEIKYKTSKQSLEVQNHQEKVNMSSVISPE